MDEDDLDYLDAIDFVDDFSSSPAPVSDVSDLPSSLPEVFSTPTSYIHPLSSQPSRSQPSSGETWSSSAERPKSKPQSQMIFSLPKSSPLATRRIVQSASECLSKEFKPNIGGNVRPPSTTSFDLSQRGPQSEPSVVTHHQLNVGNLESYHYPTNFPVRDYQRNIIKKALLRNVLCALPTGLGKTFIASVVMLNWYRWTEKSKIIFMAPTRPLITQQTKNFLEITGISINDCCVFLSNVVKLQDRAKTYDSKRIFFATPQTIENDLKKGNLNPADVVLLVIDEAHRATGKYSYVNVPKLIAEKNQSFRTLALTATPSVTFEGVQNVIDCLNISSIESRTEDSLDVQKYTHVKNIRKVLTPFSTEQHHILQLVATAIEDQVKALYEAKIIFTSRPEDLAHFQLLEGMKRFFASQARSGYEGLSHKYRAIGQAITPIVYAMGLLKTHGIFPFYDRVQSIYDAYKSSKSQAKHLGQVLNCEAFREMLAYCRTLIYESNDGLPSKERRLDFMGHPKLEKLAEILNTFFVEHGADSRAIIFAELRESAAEIVWTLQNQCRDYVDAAVFVGQASKSSSGVKGMSQKEQQAMLTAFKKGTPNVLVATSVAEEGLDIGEVDLIICYDQSQSPIRSIQRMGRTGRKREGHVYMLMTEKEQRKLETAMSGHKILQHRIKNKKGLSGVDLEYQVSPRILPDDCAPRYQETIVDVPPENQEALESEDFTRAMKTTTSTRGAGKAKNAGKAKDAAKFNGCTLESFAKENPPKKAKITTETVNLIDSDCSD